MPKSNKSQDENQLPYFDRDKLIWECNYKPNEKLVLHALNSFVGADGRCFPKQQKLAEMTGFNRSTINRVLKSLEEQGAIATEWRYRPDGSQTSNDYFMNWEALKPLKNKGVSNQHTGVAETHTPVAIDHTPCDESAHLVTIHSTTKGTDKVTTQEYLKRLDQAEPDVNGSDSGLSLTTSGSGKDRSHQQEVEANHAQHGLAGSRKLEENGPRETHETQNETDPYKKTIWRKGDPLLCNDAGEVVLPTAKKWKMRRFTAVRLAQYIIANHINEDFELMYQPSYIETDKNKVWVYTSGWGWQLEDEALASNDEFALRRMVNAVYCPRYDHNIDINELLQECWDVSEWLWKLPDAAERFKTQPIADFYAEWLSEWGVECSEYNEDEDLYEPVD